MKGCRMVINQYDLLLFPNQLQSIITNQLTNIYVQLTFKQSYQSSDLHPLHTPSTNFGILDPNSFNFTNQMMQVINAQNVLIVKLFEHQNALSRELKRKMQKDQFDLTSNDKPNIMVSGYKKFDIPEQFSISSNKSTGNQSKNNVKIIQLQNKRHSYPLKKVDFECQINSSQQQVHQKIFQLQTNFNKKKQNQSKNMVKNFAKAIFKYIRNNKEKRQDVLNLLNINQREFMKVYQSFKGNIHSITELRSLWSIQGNPFHKAFRIFSAEYLRKHCLQKTFNSRNSRVENYLIHLKYRRRLLEVLQSPLDFTALKID